MLCDAAGWGVGEKRENCATRGGGMGEKIMRIRPMESPRRGILRKQVSTSSTDADLCAVYSGRGRRLLGV